jgi:hypothetical protein
MVLQEMVSEQAQLDVITVGQRLRDRNLLDSIGGWGYLSSLMDAVPSAANVGYYVDIVREKHLLRRTIAAASAAISRAYDEPDEVVDIIAGLQRDAEEISAAVTAPAMTSTSQTMSWDALLSFAPGKDANALVGMTAGRMTRYLCRGYGGWLIGPSGIGKSSLLCQMAVAFALGKPLWGITPTRPLRVLIVQGENDIGDMAEIAQGLSAGFGIDAATQPDEHKMLVQNLSVQTVTGRIGAAFCGWLRTAISAWHAELVMIDPLLSFAGVEVSRQDQCTQFLRGWLDPVLRQSGAALLSVHHTGKPKQERNGESPSPSLYERAYQGLGSSELVNWARVIMLLEPTENMFRLLLVKRGKRACATQPDGEQTCCLWLKHSAAGIYWQQVSPPDAQTTPDGPGAAKDDGGRPSVISEILSMDLRGFFSGCRADGERPSEIADRLEDWLAANPVSRRDLSPKTCHRIITRFCEANRLEKRNKLYFLGPNA